MPWRGPAGEARHTGVTIQLWEREGKALGVPGSPETEPSGSPKPRSGTRSAPLHGAKPAGWCARAIVRQRPSGHERGKSACGSGQEGRTLRSAQRGTECVLRISRSASRAPDRYPKGQDFRLGSRQLIERVAARQRPIVFLQITSTIHLSGIQNARKVGLSVVGGRGYTGAAMQSSRVDRAAR